MRIESVLLAAELIAAGHVRHSASKALPQLVLQDLKEIGEELDILFSTLPAKPWPVEGFGSPDVESRFEKRKKQNRLT